MAIWFINQQTWKFPVCSTHTAINLNFGYQNPRPNNPHSTHYAKHTYNDPKHANGTALQKPRLITAIHQPPPPPLQHSSCVGRTAWSFRAWPWRRWAKSPGLLARWRIPGPASRSTGRRVASGRWGRGPGASPRTGSSSGGGCLLLTGLYLLS